MDNVNITDSIPIYDLVASNPVYCCLFDGKGNAIELNQQSHLSATLSQPCWLHLDYTNQESINWLAETTLLPTLAKKALIDRDQAPKEMRVDNGILVTLKGVNITPDNSPDPIVTFRFYMTGNLIISIRHQAIDAIALLKQNLDKGIGPVDVADWLIQLSDSLADQANLSFDNIHTKVTKLEDNVLNQHVFSHREIGRVRKQLFILRRLLVPKRDILTKIATERVTWIDDNNRQHLHNISTRLSHCISDIDTSLLRISSLMEQINALITESMNKRIYFMTICTLVFMPITFLTSLLGVNLAGIPFSDKSWAFIVFSGLLIIISILFLIWLKSKKWL